MLEIFSNDDDVGVIIVVERDGRGMPGSIEKHLFRILIQWMTLRRRRRRKGDGEGEKMATVSRKIRNK